MTVIREITHHELSMAQYGSIVTKAVLLGTVDVARLISAIQACAQQHRLINCKVARVDDRYVFQERTEPLKLSVIHSTTNDSMSDRLNSKVDCYESCTEITLYINSGHIEFYICSSHMISDANCIIKFQLGCLHRYAECHSNDNNNDATVMPSHSIHDEMTQQLGTLTPYSMRTLMRQHKAVTNYPADNPSLSNSDPHRIKTLTLKVNEANTLQLRNLARQNQSTIQGLLGAIGLFTLKHLAPTDESIKLSLGSAFNLRNCLPTPLENHFACGVVGHTFIYEIENRDIWSLAHNMSTDLQSCISSKDVFRFVYNYDFIKDTQLLPLNQSISDIKWQTDNASLLVSNIGNIKTETQFSGLTLDEITFMPARLNGYFILTVVSLNNRMTITLGYTWPRYSDEQMIEFQKQFNSLMKSLIS